MLLTFIRTNVPRPSQSKTKRSGTYQKANFQLGGILPPGSWRFEPPDPGKSRCGPEPDESIEAKYWRGFTVPMGLSTSVANYCG